VVRFSQASACILIFNYGRPPHLATWDLSPTGGVRGDDLLVGREVVRVRREQPIDRLGAPQRRDAQPAPGPTTRDGPAP
jgi:hypothetical protein